MEMTWQQLAAAGAALDQKKGMMALPGVQPAEPDESLIDAMTAALVMGCEFASARLGEHWQTTEAEARGLVEALDKCLPDDIRVGPWGGLMLAAGAFFGPRIIITRMEKRKPKQPATAQPQPEPAPRRPRPAPAGKVVKPAEPESSRRKANAS